MTRLILALIRFAALALSFLLSSLAAAGFVTFVLFLDSNPDWLSRDITVIFGSLGFLTALWLELSFSLFAPFCLIMVFAEMFRLKSLLTNLLLGGLCALIYMVLISDSAQTGGIDDPVMPYPLSQIWLAAIAAGFTGGFVHWVLAGHRAGRWLGPRQALNEDHESAR